MVVATGNLISILNDKAYIEMVRQTIVNVDRLHILDEQR